MHSINLLNRFTDISRRTSHSFGLCFLIATALLTGQAAMAWNTMNIPGTWDGFNAGDTVGPFRLNKVSPPGTPAGRDWYTNVMFVAASGGNVTNGGYSFKLAADGSFANNKSYTRGGRDARSSSSNCVAVLCNSG